jgi:antitoxin component of MazEF toxin-antitoxin module
MAGLRLAIQMMRRSNETSLRYHGTRGLAAMATQIARIDGAVTVEIPEDLLRQANLAVGDPVEWTLTPGGALALRAPRGTDTPPGDGYEEWKAAEIQAGLAEAQVGETVPHEKVVEWLKSWGTANELPPPQ